MYSKYMYIPYIIYKYLYIWYIRDCVTKYKLSDSATVATEGWQSNNKLRHSINSANNYLFSVFTCIHTYIHTHMKYCFIHMYLCEYRILRDILGVYQLMQKTHITCIALKCENIGEFAGMQGVLADCISCQHELVSAT